MQKGEIYEEFNEKSAKYRELSNILTENEHLLTWTDGERIVDVGCGPGDVTTHVIKPWLPADYSLLLGLDISPKMTQHGLTHHADDRVTFDTLDIGSDVSHFMLNDEYSKGFDKIISFYVMNWVRDLPTGVKNLFKLLKPGGQALLMFPVNRNFQKTYRIISDRESWREYFKNITRNISPYLNGEEPCTEFQDILKESGFEIVKCETHQKHDVFDSVSVLKELIESLDQYISCVPSELKTSYLDECVQVMTEMKALEIVDGKALVSVTKIVSVIRKPTA